MSVTNQIPYAQYTAAPGATVFQTGFRVILSTDLVVRKDGVVVSSGFTLNGLNQPAGLDVVFGVPMVGGEIIELLRQVPLVRLTDYQQLGDFLSFVVNNDFDRLWMAQQEQAAKILGVLRVPYPETIGELPASGARASKVLGFDINGAPVLYSPASAVGEAENINFVPYGSIAASNVQAAIEELVDEQGAVAGAIFDTLAGDAGSSLIGFKTAPAGSVARHVHDRLRDRISVRDFGAVGDGVANDTAALQAALDVGGLVFFPPGTYRITAGLTISPDTILQGAGRRRAIILVDGAVVGASLTYPSKVSTNVMRVEVRGLGFRGTANALGGLHFDKGDVVTIDGCDFYDFTRVGGYGVKLTNVYFWHLSNSKFENIHTFGLSLVAVAGVGCNAGICGPNNDFVGNNQALFIGTSFDRGQNILVFCNDYEGSGNGNKALDLNGVEGVHILQNYIELWQGAAIAANNGLGNKRITLEQNVINANSTQVCNFNDTSVANDRIVFRANRFADIAGGQTCVLFGNTTNVVFVDNDPAAGVPADLYAASPRTAQALTGTATWDPGALANGATTNTNVTVQGAAVGDACSVTFSPIGTRNMLINAHVAAANTVRVVLLNHEGAAVDLPSGTVRVWVFKA